jgi:hypothetical protein
MELEVGLDGVGDKERVAFKNSNLVSGQQVPGNQQAGQIFWLG